MRSKNLHCIIILLCFSLLQLSCRKKGCSSSEAINYDPRAEVDDGSCFFWGNWKSDFIPPIGKDTSGNEDSPGRFRLMTGHIPDGLTIEKTGVVLSDQASEPDVVNFRDILFVYYRSGQAGTENERICVAISPNPDTDWIYKYVSLQGYGIGELQGMRHPDVYVIEEGELVMNISAQVDGNWSILQFTSKDGLNFNFERIVIHEQGINHIDSHTSLVRKDYSEEYHLLTKNLADSIHQHFVSHDGYHFIPNGTQTFIYQDNAYFVSSTYNAFHAGNSLGIMYAYHLPSKHINKFSSEDMENWTTASHLTIMEFGTEPNEGEYLKDFCRERTRYFDEFIIYSTKIP